MDKSKEGTSKRIYSKSIFSSKNIVLKLEKILDTRNKKIAAVIFIIGILLMTMSGRSQNSTARQQLDDEKRLCSILSQIEGSGCVSAMITYVENKDYKQTGKKAKGAIIVAEGADNVEVNIKLSEAAQAVLDLPAHKVRVYKSQE